MFKISLDKTDKDNYQKALQRTSDKILSERDKLPFRCATEFQFVLLKNITSQVFKHVALKSEAYRKWKLDRVGHTDFWVLDGDLINAIRVFRDGKGWMAGIPANVSDSGGKAMRGHGKSLPIVLYGKWLEYGNPRNNQPARPVIRPTTKIYFATGFLKQINITTKEIGKQWR